MRQDSAVTLLSEGMYFDVNVLDAERQRITNKLLQNGYYKFNKEYISYTADTVRNSYLVDLTLHLAPYKQHNEDTPQNHQQYTINKVSFITDYNVLQASALNSIEVNDSLHYKGFPIYYKDKLYLRPKVLTNNLRIIPGTLYNEQNVQRTYSNYGRLQALKYTNIRFFEVQQSDSAKLNAYVMLTRGKHQSVSFEVEGTNSARRLGSCRFSGFSAPQHVQRFRNIHVQATWGIRGCVWFAELLKSRLYRIRCGSNYQLSTVHVSLCIQRFQTEDKGYYRIRLAI